MSTDKYLKTFFAEKAIDMEARFEIEGPSGANSFPYGVVVEAIKKAPHHEKHAIAGMLRKIDYANADVCSYLRHLAKALVK